MADRHETVEEQLRRWNPPPSDRAMEMIVGVPTDPADAAATAHVPMRELDQSPTNSGTDAAMQYQDDADGDADDGDVVDYGDMTNDELRDELGKRGLPKSGNKDELVARLEEDDASDEDEDDADQG